MPFVHVYAISLLVVFVSSWSPVPAAGGDPCTAVVNCATPESHLLVASDGTGGDQYGISVDLDGHVMASGASFVTLTGETGTKHGAVYILEFDEGTQTWQEEHMLRAVVAGDGDEFGTAVGLHGTTLVVGAPKNDDNGSNAGSAYVFEFDAGTMMWNQTQTLAASNASAGSRFGHTVAVRDDLIIVGAWLGDGAGTGDGAAYVFRFNDTTMLWEEEQRLFDAAGTTGDRFGFAVNTDGVRTIVGAPLKDSQAGAAFIFGFDGSSWVLEREIFTFDGGRAGESVAITGEMAVLGASRNSRFAIQTGLAEVWYFDVEEDQWLREQGLIHAGARASDLFGTTIDFDGTRVVVGAPNTGNAGFNDFTGTGSAHVFTQSNGVWVETVTLSASDGMASDAFAFSVALDTEHIVVGGLRSDGNAADSGAAYVFDLIQSDCDCDDNADVCELDCNGNGTPDDCDNDCNCNGVDDTTDVANQFSTDCNANGIADECEISATTVAPGGPFYCVSNCDVDCNDSGIPDGCELTDNDCNMDGIPDDCGLRVVCNATEEQLVMTPGTVSTRGNTAAFANPADNEACFDCGAVQLYERDSQQDLWTAGQKLFASDAPSPSGFGGNLDLHNNVLFVTGGGQNEIGAAYAFRKDEKTGMWNEEQIILGPPFRGEEFGTLYGTSVTVEHNIAAVGAPWREGTFCVFGLGISCGAVYVYEYDPGLQQWLEAHILYAPDIGSDWDFGSALDLSEGLLAVGSRGADAVSNFAGAVYLYRYLPLSNRWLLEQKIFASDGKFFDGFGVNVGIAGDVIAVGSFTGTYVFRRDANSGLWSEEAKLTVPEMSLEYGTEIAVGPDVVVVGDGQDDDAGDNAGTAHVFTYDSQTRSWTRIRKLTTSDAMPGDLLGRSLNMYGRDLFAGILGRVYAFDLNDEDCDCDGTTNACALLGGEADADGNGTPDACEGDLLQLDAGADQADVAEGSVAQVDATFDDIPGTTHSATINWGDGTADESGTVNQGLQTITGTHVYADDGMYTVTITVTDLVTSSRTDTDLLTIAVINAAPTVEAGADILALVGTPVKLPSTTFNDLGTLDTHTAEVDWEGNATYVPATVDETPFGPPGDPAGADGQVTAMNMYSETGIFNVCVKVIDDDTGEGEDCLTIIVTTCGDGTINDDEDCDDLNQQSGDGCSDVCQLEDEFVCTGEPSVCAPDCNDNGIDDAIDIGSTSTDCDTNGVPDECDQDDDVDGIPDACDVCAGFDDNTDADADTVPDGCDQCPGEDDLLNTDGLDVADCLDSDDDNDGVPDEQDDSPLDPMVCADTDDDGCDDCAVGTDGFGPLSDNDPAADGPDDDADGVCDGGDNCPADDNPDQADCDDDGTGDVCAISSGQSSDCNNNVVPDSCDIDLGEPDDNGNGIPDVCEGCETVADCADVEPLDGVRDDNCVFWECVDGTCLDTAIVFADMGGQFGLCRVDGTPDGNDRFHALNCFANVDVDQLPGYPCESAPPTAYNVDAGGPFGDCNPDGVCDGNDAFAALNAFADMTPCSCPLDGGPAPELDGPPQVIDTAGLVLNVVDQHVVSPGAIVEVDVFLDNRLSDLRGYQLHLSSYGGLRGQLTLVDIHTDHRPSQVLAKEHDWLAANIATGQLVVGLDGAGVPVKPGYLATFTYQVSRDAVGSFAIAVLDHDTNADHRTFLFPTTPRSTIAIHPTKPVQLTVVQRASR